MHVWGFSKAVADFEGSCLLTLNPIWVDAVHHLDVVPLAKLSDDLEGVVEIAPDLEGQGAVYQRLRHLAEGYLALWDQHQAPHPCASGVGSGRCAGVPGARAYNDARTSLDCLGHRQSHSPVLERGCGVQALILHEELEISAERADDFWCLNQRGAALVQRDHRCVIGNREKAAVAAYHAVPSHAPA